MTRVTKKELAMLEQEKATAHRQGIGAYKAGVAQDQNPYAEHPEKSHMAKAWGRAWWAEQQLFRGNDREGRL